MNLNPILSGKRMTLNVEAEFTLQELAKQEEIHYLSPLSINGIIKKTGDYLRMQIRIQTKIAMPCARCLAEVELPIDLESEVNLLTEDNISWEDDYDGFVIEDDKIDLVEIATLEIMQEIPIQPLCSEDCQGLCDRCGKNLNSGECNCEAETDSRFDILKELL